MLRLSSFVQPHAYLTLGQLHKKGKVKKESIGNVLIVLLPLTLLLPVKRPCAHVFFSEL